MAAAAQLGIPTPSGLTYVVTRAGNGRSPRPGEMVFGHYTVLLPDGTKIESSLDRGEPFGFPQGEGAVIKGMDGAVARLSLGDQAVLIIQVCKRGLELDAESVTHSCSDRFQGAV